MRFAPSLCYPPKRASLTDAPSEVFRPFDVFPAKESHFPGASHRTRLCCVLRVSHPLDALLPPWPVGLISSRSRPWGSPSEVLLPPPRRTPSRAPTPLLTLCDSNSPTLRSAQSHPRLQGLHATKIPPGSLGFSQVPYGYLHGILPSGVFSPVVAIPMPKHLPPPLSCSLQSAAS
jgi:hypothetical protein